ncbi:FkbM family methyltransferase [Hydrotalea sp.]|uniref:FkbM family methyltransferase n=1 Tax=Hydrotalea sp. TaxID=2881279 RepID=UPI003D0DDB45
MKFKKYLKQLIQLTNRFGGLKGLVVFILINSKGKGIIILRLKQLRTPIYLRANTSDIDVFFKIFVEEEYNFFLPANAEFIIDGGANIGLSALFFVIKYPNAKIVAIEPENSNYSILLKNIAGYPNIIPMQKAIWHESTILSISNPLNMGNYGFMVTTNEADEISFNEISTITIPDIIKDYQQQSVDILKLDIEGAEMELFSNNAGWVESIHQIYIETHDWIKTGCSKALFTAVQNYQYDVFSKGENLLWVNHSISKGKMV